MVPQQKNIMKMLLICLKMLTNSMFLALILFSLLAFGLITNYVESQKVFF
jgi:hypothetical protein